MANKWGTAAVPDRVDGPELVAKNVDLAEQVETALGQLRELGIEIA